MRFPRAVGQHRVLSLSTLFLAIALVMPAAVSAEDVGSTAEVTTEKVAPKVKGSSTQKRVAGPKASCPPFKNGVTYKLGEAAGKGVVKRDFGAGAGDRGELIFTDPETGTGLFWTDEPDFLAAHITSLVGDPGDVELVGLLFEAKSGSLSRQALLDRLEEQAAAAGVTQEQLFDTLGDMASSVDGGCLWSTRFVPRKRDRGKVVSFWDALIGQPGFDAPPLDQGRFQVKATWQELALGEQTVEQSFDALSIDDSALGFFFDVGDTRLLVRLIDACSANDHFWVFASAATDVEFELTVTDTLTNETKTYSNPLQAAPAITDTSAFATCP